MVIRISLLQPGQTLAWSKFKAHTPLCTICRRCTSEVSTSKYSFPNQRTRHCRTPNAEIDMEVQNVTYTKCTTRSYSESTRDQKGPLSKVQQTHQLLSSDATHPRLALASPWLRLLTQVPALPFGDKSWLIYYLVLFLCAKVFNFTRQNPKGSQVGSLGAQTGPPSPLPPLSLSDFIF